MADGDGSGRLDRIEALLESAGRKIEEAGRKIDRVADMGYAHDDRLTRIEISIEEMIDENKRREAVLAERDAATDKRINQLAARGAALDERVDKLVMAIGEWIARLPAPK